MNYYKYKVECKVKVSNRKECGYCYTSDPKQEGKFENKSFDFETEQDAKDFVSGEKRYPYFSIPTEFMPEGDSCWKHERMKGVSRDDYIKSKCPEIIFGKNPIKKYPTFEDLKGETLTDISVSEDKEDIVFTTKKGKKYELFSGEMGCGNDVDVRVDDICGDLKDLIGSPLLQAEESTNHDDPQSKNDDCLTWTFYRMATKKGFVTIKWYGASNGYYSTDVRFQEIN